MAHRDGPFQPLTHAEFSRLPIDQKLAYLARAIERLSDETSPIFAGPPPTPNSERDPQ